MRKNVDSPAPNNLSRLRALRAEKPDTQMGQVRWAWPDIQAALELGHSLKAIHQRLSEGGIEIPYRRLSFYIGRLRREHAPAPALGKSDVPVPPPRLEPPVRDDGPQAESGMSAESGKRDPLANLKKLDRARSGFHFDENPPDLNKLV